MFNFETIYKFINNIFETQLGLLATNLVLTLNYEKDYKYVKFGSIW